MVNQDDAVLMDYLSGLLTPASVQRDVANASEEVTCSLASQACLKVKVGEQDLLLPLADLSGMQAICGPLIAKGGAHWQGETHTDQVLLDLRGLLNIKAVAYDLSSWQGHSLKLKQTQQSVLVDSIVGPVHSAGHEQWQSFNGVRYSLVIG
jgi:hypothetical protein